MIRIDPLTEEGIFDTDFYGSSDYNLYRERILWYVKQEGFDLKPDTYFIFLVNHYWQVQITPFQV